MKYLIGLTGLLGSGKSVVADEFSRLGAFIIDTDEIAHEITSPNGQAITKIKACFGSSYLDHNNALNRKKMLDLVFNNLAARSELEEILHPIILAKTKKLILQSNSVYNIIAVPLLFKSLKYLSMIDRSLFVDSEEELLLNRVMLRSKLTKQQISSILNAQTPRDVQILLCDDVLANNSTIDELYNNVLKLDIKYKNLCQNII